jgi:hypothetical protein
LIQFNQQDVIYAAESAVGVLGKGKSTFAIGITHGRCTSPFDSGELLNHEHWGMGKH